MVMVPDDEILKRFKPAETASDADIARYFGQVRFYETLLLATTALKRDDMLKMVKVRYQRAKIHPRLSVSQMAFASALCNILTGRLISK